MLKFRSNIKIILDGRKHLTLRPENYLTTGGEASIYRLGKTIIKLYTDPSKMKSSAMQEKIRLLSTLHHPFIVSPKGLVFSEYNDCIGYYMDFVEGEPLSRVFTNAFRKRENFTDKKASVLVEKMQQAMQYAHSKGFRMVDPNEMNWLLVFDKKGNPEPRILDVDSWASSKWPASVIMPSIRDWHNRKFTELTDWFAWGIVTFQLYTGIHPYKGRLAGYKMGDLEKRMKNNASVFSNGIRLNRAIRDFSLIPDALLDWYIDTFQNGKRSLPPSPFAKGNYKNQLAQRSYLITKAVGNLLFEELLSCKNDKIVKVFPFGVVLLDSGKLIDVATKREIAVAQSSSCEIIKINNAWLKAEIINKEIQFSYIDGFTMKESLLDFYIKEGKLLRYENRLFILNHNGLAEVSLSILSKAILSVGNVWKLIENASSCFDGVLVQNLMGATYLLLAFGEKSLAQLRVKALDGFKIIQAKAGNRFVVLMVLDKKGLYYRIEIVLDKDYQNYSLKKELVDSPELNITILPKRVCARIVEDASLEILVPSTSVLKKIADRHISTLMELSNIGDKVVYLQDGILYLLRMV